MADLRLTQRQKDTKFTVAAWNAASRAFYKAIEQSDLSSHEKDQLLVVTESNFKVFHFGLNTGCTIPETITATEKYLDGMGSTNFTTEQQIQAFNKASQALLGSLATAIKKSPSIV